MSRAFVHQSLPMRVVFGAGALAQLPAEVETLGISKALVLCSPEQEQTGRYVAEALGEQAAGVLPEARMHVPLGVAARARDVAGELGADGCVAVGGGSAVGLGKAIALEFGLPVLAVPTTYAGSEMTSVWGVTDKGEKRTGKDVKVLPRSVIYDPELTLTLPVEMSVTSGMNAVAHAVEALYASDVTPIISLMAEEGARALLDALPRIQAGPQDIDARADALYGAWLCGACLGATTMSLHHKLCHAIGGTLDLPHAATHTVVLPHVLAYNLPAAPEALAAMSRAFGGTGDPARALSRLSAELGAPRSLRELGMNERDIPQLVNIALANPYENPREVTAEGIEALIRAAWAGEEPPPLGTP